MLDDLRPEKRLAIVLPDRNFPILQIEGLVKDFGAQRVLDGATLQLKARERAALVGPNGAGKSTLLKILAGIEEADEGRITTMGAPVRIGYLPQDASTDPDRTVEQEVLSGVADLTSIEEEMRSLESRLDAGDLTEEELDELLDRHADLQEDFERRGGYGLAAEMGRVLGGLGFAEADRTRLTGEFSGGWQMRIALARLLIGRPDVLLLDEPTNHLDLAAIEWLEQYARSAHSSMLIVSHDRYFMDAVVQRVFELRAGRIEEFVGGYSAYRTERERRDEAAREAAGRQQQEIERLETYIRRYKAGNRATMAKSREKMLARVVADRVEGPRRERKVSFKFPQCPPSGKAVVSLEHVTRAYGDRTVLKDVSLTIERGERIALIGPNGAGKSTLLRLIGEQDAPTRGRVEQGVGVQVAYFAQNQAEQLDPTRTVLAEVYAAAPPGWDEPAVRDLLGRFLFSGEEQLKSVAGLSGGERSRVALAKLLLRPNNLLLLDEPTNHLDIPTRERLEETLTAYSGTLVFATHDRYLVDRLATMVVEVSGQAIHVYHGTYSDYRRAKEAVPASPLPTPPPAGKEKKEKPAPARRAGREQRQLATETRDVEQKLNAAEAALRQIETSLSDPASYQGDIQALAAEHAAAAERVKELIQRWEDLAALAEGAA